MRAFTRWKASCRPCDRLFADGCNDRSPSAPGARGREWAPPASDALDRPCRRAPVPALVRGDPARRARRRAGRTGAVRPCSAPLGRPAAAASSAVAATADAGRSRARPARSCGRPASPATRAGAGGEAAGRAWPLDRRAWASEGEGARPLLLGSRPLAGSRRRRPRTVTPHVDDSDHDKRNDDDDARARPGGREDALMPRLVPRSRDAGLRRRLWRPPAHWRLLGFCLLVVSALILFEGFATHTIGVSAEPHDALGGPAPLAGSRPILRARGDRLVSVQPRSGRRVALTFDDGPDPRWTPAARRASEAPRRAARP